MSRMPIALLLLAAAAAAQSKPSLLPNGGFEEGKGGRPAGWDPPDGLTSFWVEDPLRPGRCLRFDTDVHKEDYYRRREEMRLPAPPPPAPKRPTRAPKYDTAAGITGVPFFSGFVPIDPKQPYRLTLEFMPGRAGLPDRPELTPKVFVKGYVVLPREVWDEKTGKAVSTETDRVAFKEFLDLKDGAPGRWTSYTFLFFPGRRVPAANRLKVMLFPYWPPGEYFFDNVRLEPATAAEWERETARLQELERRERERRGRVQPGRGAGNPPSPRQRAASRPAGGGE